MMKMRKKGTITIYGDPKSYAAIQKHLEECGFEDVGGDFTYIPNDLKEVTPEQRETLDKMVERLEEFDDVQTVDERHLQHQHRTDVEDGVVKMAFGGVDEPSRYFASW